jgi:hypothetical protein
VRWTAHDAEAIDSQREEHQHRQLLDELAEHTDILPWRQRNEHLRQLLADVKAERKRRSDERRARIAGYRAAGRLSPLEELAPEVVALVLDICLADAGLANEWRCFGARASGPAISASRLRCDCSRCVA